MLFCFQRSFKLWNEKRVVGYSCEQLFHVVSQVIFLAFFWEMAGQGGAASGVYILI